MEHTKEEKCCNCGTDKANSENIVEYSHEFQCDIFIAYQCRHCKHTRLASRFTISPYHPYCEECGDMPGFQNAYISAAGVHEQLPEQISEPRHHMHHQHFSFPAFRHISKTAARHERNNNQPRSSSRHESSEVSYRCPLACKWENTTQSRGPVLLAKGAKKLLGLVCCRCACEWFAPLEDKVLDCPVYFSAWRCANFTVCHHNAITKNWDFERNEPKDSRDCEGCVKAGSGI